MCCSARYSQAPRRFRPDTIAINRADAVRIPVFAGQAAANDAADCHKLLIKISGHGRRPHLRGGKIGIAGVATTDEIAGGDGIKFVWVKAISIDQIFAVAASNVIPTEISPRFLFSPTLKFDLSAASNALDCFSACCSALPGT